MTPRRAQQHDDARLAVAHLPWEFRRRHPRARRGLGDHSGIGILPHDLGIPVGVPTRSSLGPMGEALRWSYLSENLYREWDSARKF